MRALVAEDSGQTLKYLSTLLGYYGTVDHATSRAEALDLYEKAAAEGKPYGVAFVDLIRPLSDAFELQRAIRQLEANQGVDYQRRTRLVLTTSHLDNQTVLSGFSSGADLFMPKPFTTKQVHAFLKEAGFKPPQRLH